MTGASIGHEQWVGGHATVSAKGSIDRVREASAL